MTAQTQIVIPSLVRIKPGALDRLGIYLRRHAHSRALLMTSEGMLEDLCRRAQSGLDREGIETLQTIDVGDASHETASEIFAALPSGCSAIVGLGGGRALDTAKYVAFLAGLPYYAVPTSLSNDGFASPGASLTIAGKRRSLKSAMPFAVVVDTEVCRQAPDPLWWSGVGDLMAKLTAIFDWKLAFHRRGTEVNDFAALLSDATVHQFIAEPSKSIEGVRLLATALMLNGIAMEICGSSRPASGSEHLVSHALDEMAVRPRLHGIQVGLATYVISRLQGQNTERIASVFDTTGVWRGIEADPYGRDEWLEAVRLAPTIKDDFYTILSDRDCLDEVATMIDSDPRLENCFVR